MEPGAYVVRPQLGLGQIKSYDEAAQKLVINFKDKKGHAMDPAFCVTTMEVLPEKHLLVRKETETKKNNELIAEHPVQLVRRGPAGLSQSRHVRHRPRDHPRPGHRRGEVQEVVVRRQEGHRPRIPASRAEKKTEL